MSQESDNRPIEPGEGGRLDRFARQLGPLVWLVVVYFGIAWWRGEPPSLGTVVNVFSIAVAALALLGLKGSPERRLRKRLRRLFKGGRVPEATEVLAVLEGSGESPLRDATERYARGILSSEGYLREMAGLLELERSFKDAHAA